MLPVEFVPTYDYECPKCQRTWEVRQRISEPALTTCDRCGGPIRRLIAPAPFILKGGGWYVTDYPSEARKKAMSSEGGGDKGAASDAKPAASGEAKPADSKGGESGSGTGSTKSAPAKDSGSSAKP
jgi:putative FmdB family regulatory protein